MATATPLPTISHTDLMHPTLVRAPFTASGWVFETKLDGFRALARKTGRTVELVSRNGRSLAEAFPDVVAAIGELCGDVVLDCKLVVVDAQGRPMWDRLRRRALIRRPSWAIDAALKEPA